MKAKSRALFLMTGKMRALRVLMISLFLAACFPAHASDYQPVPVELASGVYAVIGAQDEPSVANGGAVGNQGILVGDTGVIVIDTGTNDRYGHDLLKSIARITSKPVVLAINTHQNPAFVFGNGAMRSQGASLLAHRDTDGLINERCIKCLMNLTRLLGKEQMQGTAVVRPNKLVDGNITLEVAGRTIDILYFGQTSTKGAIAVLDRASGILFGGGIVSIDTVPDVKDANFRDWTHALDALLRMNAKLVVPGRGPVSAPARMKELSDYLTQLLAKVDELYQSGTGMVDARVQAALPAFRKWVMYDIQHPQNVIHVYKNIENKQLDKDR